ncbi:MAG: hypothetical protein WDW38_011284 [Sanguina aurantia]
MSAMMMKSRMTSSCASIATRPVARNLCVVVRACKQTKQTNPIIKPALMTVVANVIMALPASADAGKIFDFNLTLPVMAGQFLLLMVFLDKFWFTPVGKVLDERDGMIRDKLASVKDNSGDVSKFAKEAEEILRKARSEVAAMITSKKNVKQAELDKVYNEYKARVTAEVDASIAAVEVESASVLKALDAKVEQISTEVLKRVLPASVKI